MSSFAKPPQDTFDYQVEWEKQYQQLFLKFLAAHEVFDGSAVAAWMREQGLPDPAHHNMWGAQITYYAKLGWMVPIGHGAPSGAAHIEHVRVWRSTKFKKRGSK